MGNVIYKYCKPHRAKDILQTNQLHFSKPAELNDRLDSLVRVDFMGKTPKTNRISTQEYGAEMESYPIHQDLAGAISQALNQKHVLQKDFRPNEAFEVWNPKTILIIGSEENEKFSSDRRSCFELFRNNQKDIKIIMLSGIFAFSKIPLSLLKK